MNTPSDMTFALPGWVYRNNEFLKLEKEYLFRRNWLPVGHVNDLPDPGDYLTLDIADELILVIRDEHGELHCLHNVCRHRASRLAPGMSGHCTRALVCPYHGWSYNLDGSLRGIPAEHSFPGLDKNDFGLPAIEFEIWMGFIFVRIDGHGPSVADMMAPVAAEVSLYNLPRLQPVSGPCTELVEANWKCIIDNDSEGYHVPKGHPGLNRLFSEYIDEPHPHGISRSVGRVSQHPSGVWSEYMYQRLLTRVDYLPNTQRDQWLYLGWMPCLAMGIYADSVELYTIIPISSERTLMRSQTWALPDNGPLMKALRFLNKRINTQVWQEDLFLVRNMKEGLHSSSYHGGPLSDLEPALKAFHQTIRDVIPVAELDHAPTGDLRRINSELRAGPKLAVARQA